MKIVLILTSTYVGLFGLTLSESIDLAINNSPKVSISKSNIKYSEHIKDRAMGAYHPTLDAGFSFRDLSNPTTFAFSPTHNYSLSLKYNLFNGFTDSSTISSKNSELESSKLENISVIADLRLDVVVAYANYLKAKKSIKVQEEQLASLIKQYDNTNIRYEQGILAKNDLLLIDVDKLKAEQALIKAKSDYLVARSNLERTIATTISHNDTIDDFDTSVDDIAEISALELIMLESRSEIKAMMFKSESLISQKDAVKGNYFPKVNLEASHQINDKERFIGTEVLQPSNQTTFGVNASWNLYSGMRDIEMQKAILEKDNQLNYQLHQLKLDLRYQLREAYEGFKVAKSAKYVAARAQESAKENYRITSDRFSYGDIDTLTLLVSQSTLTQAVNANNNAYYNLYVAFKTLQRIVGE